MCGPNVARKALPATGKLEAIETEAQRNLRLGTILGSLSLALTVASFSLTMPHLQGRRDALQCDTLCLGSMTSARSALSLLGGFFISRLSDSNTSFLATTVGGGSGRKGCLYIGTVASVIGLVVGATTFSLDLFFNKISAFSRPSLPITTRRSLTTKHWLERTRLTPLLLHLRGQEVWESSACRSVWHSWWDHSWGQHL